MDQFLEFAEQLARAAGDIMLEHFQIGVSKEIKASEGYSPMTVADKAINQMVIDSVRAAFPEHAVLGEEQSLRLEGAPYTWVCDPIDGTLPYSAGIPTNVFSLALIDSSDGQTKVAVVFDPYMKRLYQAVEKQGAYVNGTSIHVNQVAALSDAFIGTSSQRSKYVNATTLKTAVIGNCFRTFSFNCSIYEAMLIATGQIAGLVFVGSGAHDLAAANLIVREAGGQATDLFGESQRYDTPLRGGILSNGPIHEELVGYARQNRLPDAA